MDHFEQGSGRMINDVWRLEKSCDSITFVHDGLFSHLRRFINKYLNININSIKKTEFSCNHVLCIFIGISKWLAFYDPWISWLLLAMFDFRIFHLSLMEAQRLTEIVSLWWIIGWSLIKARHCCSPHELWIGIVIFHWLLLKWLPLLRKITNICWANF